MDPSGLIGRDEERIWLEKSIATATREEVGCALLITGEAGIGKTHFLAHALPSERILTTIAFPQARLAAPGWGLRRLAEGAGPAGEALETELQRTDDPGGGWKLLSICDRADELVATHPGKIVVFDDLQWADELTLAWLSRTGDRLAELRTILVLAARGAGRLPTRVGDALVPLRRAQLLAALELPPLTPQEIRRLAERSGFPVRQDVAEILHRRTNGLPLAAEELLRQATRRGATLERADDLRDVGISSSHSVLAGVVREQTSTLDDDALEVLAIVSLMSQPAAEDAIRETTGFARERFDLALENALSSALLMVAGPGHLRFRHELHREAFVAELGIARRRSLHRRIATALIARSHYPAAKVAEQFVQAGVVDDALEWLEIASAEAMRAHDHGNALTQLAVAIDLCSPGDAETRTRLVELVVLAARASNQPSVGIELVEKALSFTSDARHRGRLFLCLARLVSFFGDNEARATTLGEARAAFAAAGDDAGMARVLGEIALPTGRSPTISERIALGREGLELAERSNDAAAISLCAANLAVAELRAGNPDAFALWARSVEVSEADASTGHGEEVIRNRTNWAIGALDYGFYGEAERVLQEGRQQWDKPFWREFSYCISAIHHWRVGDWNRALQEASLALSGVSRPEVKAMATALQASICFEREAHPDISPLEGAVRSLIDMADEQWGAVAQSILMRIRATRREPQPERGLSTLLDIIMSTGVRIGWDDLLPAIAEIDRAQYLRTIALLGEERATGKRAEASARFARGLATLREDARGAEDLLFEAAELYESLPDPYFIAKALEHTAEARALTGRRAGKERARAAEIYRDLGADRSLAHLLRRSGGSRALSDFRVPPTQAKTGAPGLTPREREVAELARQGYTTRAIAELLGISPATAKKHLERVKAKLLVERKSDLVRLLSPGPRGV